MKLQFSIHHYHHYPDKDEIMSVLDTLRQEVQEARSAQESAIVLILGLKAKIDALAANATELNQLKSALAELSSELSDSTDSLADAVARNDDDPSNDPVDET